MDDEEGIAMDFADKLVRVHSQLKWLKGYFEGLDDDHEEAEQHVKNALNAIDNDENEN